MEAAHGGGGCPAVPRTRRAATAAPPARSAPASPGTSTPPDPPGRRAACPRSAAVAATPGCRSPTPPAAPGSACCSRSGAYRRNCTDVCQPRQRLRGAHLNAPDCQPTSASQCPRHSATRRRPRPANCLNPRQWCSRMRSSHRHRSSPWAGRTSTSPTCTCRLPNASAMRALCCTAQRAKKARAYRYIASVSPLRLACNGPVRPGCTGNRGPTVIAGVVSRDRSVETTAPRDGRELNARRRARLVGGRSGCGRATPLTTARRRRNSRSPQARPAATHPGIDGRNPRWPPIVSGARSRREAGG